MMTARVRIMRRRGFTLVEIMIVVMIIAMLLGIAMPNFYRARERSRQKACQANLVHIEAAKEEFAMDQGLPDGAPVSMSDLCPAYINAPGGLHCPAGGNYTVNPVGTPPTCDYQSTDYPHVMP